jgi:hypothetical protein
MNIYEESTINSWIWNSWRIFIIGCLQAHRRRRESETERAWIIRVTYRLEFLLCTLTPGLAYSQILLAWIYEPLVLVNTVISWIRLADLNPCTTCTMYLSWTIFLFRSGIAFYFHLLFTVQITVRPKKMCVYGYI